MSSLRTLVFVPVLLLGADARPQGGYFPDPRVRAMINDQWPGMVDANGYMDVVLWGNMSVQAVGLNAAPYLEPGDTLDMTGIEMLVSSSYLTIQGDGPGLNGYYIPIFPGFTGNDVTFCLTGIHPDDLYGQPVMVPPWIQRYNLVDAGELGPSLYIPGDINYFTIMDCDLVDGAGWDLPDFLSGLEIYRTPIQNIPDVTTVLQLLWLVDCGLTTTPSAYHPNVQVLDFSQNPITSWSPFTPDLHTLRIRECGLTDLPPGIPDGLTALEIDSNAISNQMVLPSQLLGLRAANCGWDLLPQLPPDLMYLYVQNNAIVSLPSQLPDLVNLDLSGNAALTCLADFPWSLDQTKLDGTSVTCLPHAPNFGSTVTPASLAGSICGILDECPSQMPVISGTTFRDDDADGARDVGEPGLPFCSVLVDPGGWLAGVDASGHYEMQVPYGSYTITGQPRVHHVLTSTAQSAFVNQFTLADSLNDFGYAPDPDVPDLVADVTGWNLTLGMNSSIQISVWNVGTADLTADLQLTFDAVLEWVNSSITPDIQSGNSASWSATIPAGGSWSAVVVIHLPMGPPNGTPITHTFTATPTVTDATPQDNVAIWNGIVLGSFDPNDKVVVPSELSPDQVAAGERVTYTVRFQNTGNAPASRVVITDTLSEDLQSNTMNFVASSHTCTWSLINGVLVFLFDPIILPDSTSDEPGSHGFVKFSFVPSSSLALGESVGNVANIYFDFNDPVITNEAVFSVEASTFVAEEPSNTIRLWPNPAADQLIISGAQGGDQVEVCDALGRVVRRFTTAGDRSPLDVSALASGSYSVRLVHGGQVSMLEFLKR